ncbi:Abi family protein [Citricoccus sp. NPDC079358]|uniref:Abi family protein n=1 Tax=Citricoccus sp. NPDC079358 TaxID=3154653 RepID=UPI00344FEF5F
MAEQEKNPKEFKSYDEQVDRLVKRGMYIRDRDWAAHKLQQINYYRLSGYWYPFRKMAVDESRRTDSFLPGTTITDVIALYEFDIRLRTAIFAALSPIELTVRALLGHELGRIAQHIHLDPSRLGPVARRAKSSAPSERYVRWREKYDRELALSHEDFVRHHHLRYSGKLPVWAAVEILDWGQLTHLFAMSPHGTRTAVADAIGISAPQMESWLKSLNIVRNVAAHHGRMFNRVYDLKPKLPSRSTHPELVQHASVMNRAFGQLTVIQYILRRLSIGNPRLIPAVLATYPEVNAVPLRHTGAPNDWNKFPLWDE